MRIEMKKFEKRVDKWTNGVYNHSKPIGNKWNKNFNSIHFVVQS